jgi:2-amino-4-hydroxy-6-hydroxymethyldihydropteridine diphosphokinase
MSATASIAVIALGANLGDREATIRQAVSQIDSIAGVTVTAASGLVESHAVKLAGVDEAAPNYLNAVLLATSELDPESLLDALNEIELRNGRVREERWGDRTLDLDLIAVDEVELQSERLTLPHPRAWQRPFVLDPWLQVDRDARLPQHGPLVPLLAAASPAEVWPYPAEPLFVGAGFIGGAR